MYLFSNQIIDYDLFYSLLENIEKNKDNKFPVIKLNPIGKSVCGFSIEHLQIGKGPFHIVYMAGAHENEIIGVILCCILCKI